MTVEELRELLQPMPDTARVVVLIRHNVRYDGLLSALSNGPREAEVLKADYQGGEVLVRLDEL